MNCTLSNEHPLKTKIPLTTQFLNVTFFRVDPAKLVLLLKNVQLLNNTSENVPLIITWEFEFLEVPNVQFEYSVDDIFRIFSFLKTLLEIMFIFIYLN
jgi:hypothetical protein